MTENEILSLEGDIVLNPDRLMEQFLSKEYGKLSEYFLSVLDYFGRKTYTRLNVYTHNFINLFVENFLYFFLKEEYLLDPSHALQFIRANATIANLVRISDFRTTDTQLQLLIKRKNNLTKILTLYSARNSFKPSHKILFDTNPGFASIWYVHFFDLYSTSLASESAYKALSHHLRYTDERMQWAEPVAKLYYGSSYLEGDLDRQVKGRINQATRKKFNTRIEMNKAVESKRIAVVSESWKPTHAVFKNHAAFVEALKDDYELTFFQLGPNQDTSLFERTELIFQNNTLNVEPILRGEFALIYYPDVGMSEHSITLANLRLAPVQVCSYGHSVSTFGSEIDYYIVGRDVEDIDKLDAHYSERPVLIPGLGIIHNIPTYERHRPRKRRDEIVVNCPWAAHKCNFKMLGLLRRAAEAASRPVFYRFFTGASVVRNNGYIPFIQDVAECLESDLFEVLPWRPYAEYMELMEEADFTLDSHPYGGCNTVVDSLLVGKPVVAWRGKVWNNRIGPRQLELLGLEELVVEDDEHYLELAVRLISDEEYRNELISKVEALNLVDTILFDRSQAGSFKRAIDYLLEHVEELSDDKEHTPIEIS